jgi:hypothetical protein
MIKNKSWPLYSLYSAEFARRSELEWPTWKDIKNLMTKRQGQLKRDGRYVASFERISLHPTLGTFSELGYWANCRLVLHPNELGITLYSAKLLDTRRQNYSIFPVELSEPSSEYVAVNTPTITLLQSMKSTLTYNDTPFEVVCGLFDTLGLMPHNISVFDNSKADRG